MPDDAKPQPIKEGTSNPTRGSKVMAQAEHPPLFFLRPETGEVIAVPVRDANALYKEIGEWNSLVATLHDANAQVQYFEDSISKLALAPDRRTPGAKEEAERHWKIAVAWQEQVVDTCQTKIASLSKIGSAGKQLVELIPLPTAPAGQASSKPGEYKDGKYSKELKGSWATGAKRAASKDWIRPPMGSLAYVASDQIATHWPTFKDPAKTKWTDIIAKDENGKRKIHRDKAVAYGKEAIKKAKAELKDAYKLDVDIEGSIGSWATVWNADTAHTLGANGKLTSGFITGDIGLDAGAQFMRYLYGASLNGTCEPLKMNVSFRAEGHAELAIAEAKAAATIFFPCKDGWMWSLPAALTDKDAAAKDIDLGAVRFAVSLEVKGAVGASIAAEVSLGIETRVGQLPVAVGRQTLKRGNRVAKKVAVLDKLGPEEKMRVAGLNAKLDAFAGLKADAELKGAIEWRNPESKEKKFEAFAAVAPAVGGMMGLGAGGKLAVEYVDGVFRLEVAASICVGLGAEGTVSFEVSLKLLASFVKWVFYQLYHANFRRLVFIRDSAFRAAKELVFVAVYEGLEIIKLFGLPQSLLTQKMDAIRIDLRDAAARQQLARRILSDPEALRYAPPESKGMLIHELCSDNIADWTQSGFGIGDAFLRDQKAAIKYILKRWSHTRSECENVVQHISSSGSRGDFAKNLARLRRFFNEESPYNVDLPGFESRHWKDFDDWYKGLTASLKDRPTRGLPVTPSDSVQYAMQHDDDADHPMFTSIGDNAFYA